GLIAQQTPATSEEGDRQALLERIAILERELGEREQSGAVLAASAQPPVQAAAAAQTSSVTGRVTDAQGAVIANAEVTLGAWTPAMPGMKMAQGQQFTARSAANGSFTLTQIPPGQYVLQVDAPGYGRSSQELKVPSTQTLNIRLELLELPGAETSARPAGAPAPTDNQVLVERIRVLEERLNSLEASTVLSEPETRVKRIEVFVDKNGNEYDKEVPGAKKKVTYQRERVYRRQTINEKIEDALGEQEKRSVKLGVSAAIIPQFAFRTTGEKTDADKHAYQLANADLFFTAKVAQHTMFYADVVGLSGTPPDLEVSALTLLNGYTARLVRQNELNLREAWLRTEVFKQRLALSAGRLDLTNYFDHNAVANDETSQFLSDSLVNNPALGLAVNGSGFAAVLDPKKGLNFKIGFQQSNPAATSLSDSIFSLAEVGYFLNPFGLGEGNYRVWYRVNSTGKDAEGPLHRAGAGISFDQRLSPTVTLFGRYGAAQNQDKRDRFYSGGFQFRNHLVFNPGDYWAVGYSQSQLVDARREHLTEGYYNFQLTERLKLSLHLTHVLEMRPDAPKQGFLVPGIRLAAAF
ncbi:MAG TPA: carboxypeptidase regulatory-like domain-containing protein, partial [Terriglobia bacterium]|nr:carboxypeptidase regulatory-like domain-containing protein [Terriglobia bacterium]